MRWYSTVFTFTLGCTMIACSPAEAPPDDRMPPPAGAGATDERPSDPGTRSADAAPTPQVIHYDCEGTQVDASFDGRDQASVSVDGVTMTMRTEAAASGAKYSDGEGNVLWTRGATDALLMRPDHPDRTCTGTPVSAI